MKKVFLSLAVVFSVAMISCGGNKAKEEAMDTPVAVEEPAVDAAAQVVAEGVEMQDSITPDGQTIQVPVAAVVEVAEGAEAAQ